MSDKNDAVFRDGEDCLKKYIGLAQSNLEADEMEDLSKNISSIIQSYSQLLQHHDLSCTAVEKVKAHCNSEQCDLESFNSNEIFKAELAKIQASSQNKKDPCAELNKLLNNPAESSELQVIYETQTQIDPYTKKPIEVPYKSTKCSHMFEYQTVKTMFKDSKGKKNTCKCPHFGCIAVLTLEDIEKV